MLCSGSSTRKSSCYGTAPPSICAVVRMLIDRRALTAPGYLPEWHIGVRVVKTGKLVAFISGIKVEIRVRAK